MPFDPNFPASNSVATSAPMRAQFQSLKALIDAVPVISGAVVDGVTTLPPGGAAAASVSLAPDGLHFAFELPQGMAGPQGPPFALALVDSTTTMPPGSSAAVNVSFDGAAVHFSFGIPQGEAGEQGPPGLQGIPGEVTLNDLNAGLLSTLGQTSSNSNGVSTLDSPFANDPPTLADLEVLRAKINELIGALRR